MVYTDLAACLNEVKTNPATRGLIAADYDDYLTNQLTISAGLNATAETVYRPYFVAAKFLEQLRAKQEISEAKGVKFSGLALPIESLLTLQASLDRAMGASMGLIVPAGFEAVVADASPLTVKKRPPRSYRAAIQG
jgi:hypothetical protein